MRFNYNGVQYQLGFMYPEKTKGSNPKKCVAYLKIYQNNQDNQQNPVLAQGESNCNPCDNYNYETGRGIALGRMFKEEAILQVPFLKKAAGLVYNLRKTYNSQIPTVVLEENKVFIQQ